MHTTDTRTHYLPMFTKRDTTVLRHDGEGRQQAICGSFIWPEQHRTDPTQIGCWGCRMYLENLDVIRPEARTA